MKTGLFLLLFLSCFNLFAQNKDTVTIIGVGDIMMGSNYPNDAYLPPQDGLFLMKEVESILKNADVTFGNLEGVLLNQGGIGKTCRNPKLCYLFRSPEKYVQNLVNAGFDVMSIANNHSADFGDIGIRKTVATLENAGIYQAGLLTQPFIQFEKNGVHFALIAFAPNTGCANVNDLAEAKRLVTRLDTEVDIVIVSFHAGAEGPEHEHVTRKTELFHGENRGNVYEFAHELIDVGADVVFGHGPHVTRAVEVYHDKFITYSMGNFCTYGGINVNGINGLAPIIKVFTDHAGKFYKAEITPIRQNTFSPVSIDSQKQVIKRIQQLTKQDFPESPITIDNTGLVKKSTN